MGALLEVLKYVLPSLVVFITAYLIIKSFFEDQLKQKEMEIRAIHKKDLTPLRLQAYERLVLFLERISPHSLLPRTTQVSSTVAHLQSQLLNQIRTEFEHNMSQQIYISKEAWSVTKSAKEQIIKIINQSADKIAKDAPAFELSKTILEYTIQTGSSPTDTAINFLKKEVDSYF
ncbi:MAG: hypothetical protein JXR60_11605 [Bacteroidales bacterium]|nr:hypothetical protein [Bacteroidales bacterium]